MIVTAVERLLSYGKHHGFFDDLDETYIRNRVIEVLKLEHFERREEPDIDWEQEQLIEDAGPDYLLKPLLDDAILRGLVPEDTLTYRDLLTSAIMGAMMDRPSAIQAAFNRNYGASPQAATQAFYRLNIASDYIKQSRNAKNLIWQTHSVFGQLDITVNLSKPEKDPKEILAERLAAKSSYPLCLLCKENEGYMGRVNHPGRQNLRVLPVSLAHESWYFQYSPYAYYNEHCIVFSGDHVPMAITRKTFERLLDFVQWLPHYFVGSNADLPIVGGSILSHDHFQGGSYEFPMDRAAVVYTLGHDQYSDVRAEILQWPLSVLRLKGAKPEVLVTLAEETLKAWKAYSDPAHDLLSHTGDTPHNTITPVARFRKGQYELDLVLRNNRTSEAHPEGIFHPHRHIHSIKKENIGLIEVMGLAVLPGRLKAEMLVMAKALKQEALTESELMILAHHEAFMDHLRNHEDLATALQNDEALDLLIQDGVGRFFAEGLTHCGVFKQTAEGLEGFLTFAQSLGWTQL